MDDNKPRRVPHRNLRSQLVYALTVLCLLSVAAWALTVISEKIIDARQEALIEDLKGNYADSPEALIKQLCRAQTDFIILSPPGMTRLHQPYGMMSFDPKAFPEEFLKGLVYDVESGCPVYTITVQENPKTREIHIYNGNDEPILTLARDGYDPLWLVKLLRPDTYEAKYTASYRSRMEAWLDPSRIEIELKLLPVDYIDLYAENSIESLSDALASLRSATPTVGMMMRSLQASSNLVVDAIFKVSTGMCVVVSYPDDFTNRLEMFVSSNLLDFGWSLLATNLVTAGTNTLTWVDTSATNDPVSTRFYAAGDAETDSDGDGIVDGREIRMYGTDTNSIDSDGDGLVDGYSGVITTNAYPGGIATNFNLYVEGELSWITNPNVKDTDGDGMADGWEVRNGHNPTDPNDPPNVSGTIFYSGRQTGTVWVIAVTSSNSWSTSHCSTSSPASSPNSFSYLIPDLEQTNYWVKAWLDSDLNGSTNTTEAWGVLTNIAIIVTNRVTEHNITLADPDNNTNGLPDWWEILYFGSTTNTTGSADPDSDQYTNLEEYNANTDPTNSLSHPWNLSGTVSYTGPQTGLIYVVACTNSDLWNWVGSTVITNTSAYTITHLPPEADYWVRAWVDTSGDGLPTSWEAWGGYNGNPVTLNTNATGNDFAMTDPDNDGDGLPDWWEVLYGLDPTHGGEEGAAAWWKLDEGAGTNVIDATANANHGVLMNGSNAWVTGIISNGLLLDGTNAYVEVPDSASLKPDQVSVGLWIKPSCLYTNGTVMFLSKRVPNGSAGYSLGYETDAVTFAAAASGVKSLRYPCALTADAPIHVVGTFGSTAQSLYINGTRVATTNYDWGLGFGAISQDTNVLRLGSASGAIPTNFFAGLLDDVRVFPGEWTTNQVHAIWELGADPDQDGLSNTEEYKHGTNPTNSDSDADGMLDGAEVKYGLNPLVADAMADKDGDGYLNIYEIKRGSDPSSSNSIPAPTHIVTNGFSTIQAMINCVTQDYAVVQVKAGTYSGAGNTNLDFGGKKLMLVSESGAATTIIDCLNTGRGFNFHSGETNTSVLRGFTVKRGKADWGAGIQCVGASPWINECIIVSNSLPATGGGCGLNVQSGRPVITSTLFRDNGKYASGVNGGAVACFDGAVISNCEFRGNNAYYGGAIYGSVTGVTPATVVACLVVSNFAFNGGGVWLSNRIDFAESTVSSNTAYCYGGGVWCGGQAALSRSTIYGNNAGGCGGAVATVMAGNKAPVLTEVALVSNVTAGGGGGLYHYSGGETPLVLSNCTIKGNVATTYGGGAYTESGGVVLSGGAVEGNSATSVGGMAVMCAGKGPVEFRNARIVGNIETTTAACGGIFVSKGTNDADVVLSGLLVSNNCSTASNGSGGIFVTSAGAATMVDCEVAGNRGRLQGVGGAYFSVSRTATVSRCRIQANVGGGLSGGLAFISGTSPRVLVQQCVISDNVSSNAYGGLYIYSYNGAIRVESSAIVNNWAAIQGGAGFSYAGWFQNCVVGGNVCGAYGTVGGLVDRGDAGSLGMRNCVAWGNSGQQLSSGVVASNSCIQGGYTNNGSSNIITNDPKLVDGYRLLSPGSPCIGAGTATGLPSADINGDAYPNPSTPDIGCNGYQFMDANSNGINDAWEQYYFGGLDHNGAGDADNDGLTDAQEYTAGTVPTDRDTDHDGLPDGWEVARGLNPINPGDAGGDWNGDGIANSNDFQRGLLAVRVTVADSDWNDDSWDLLFNGDVVASARPGNGYTDTEEVHLEAGRDAHFTLRWVDTGQTPPDEYVITFAPMDWPSNQVPWVASPDNSPLADTNYDTDTSGLHWDFSVPTNMLQQNVKAGGTTALTTDPINTINGNNTLNETDLAVACPVFDLAFVRAYNSAATASNTLGRGWTHSLDWSLATVSNAAYGSRAGTFKVMTTGDGQSYWFCTEADGSFTLAPPQTANLALVFSNGEFRVKWPGGTVARFDTNGVIQRLEDGFHMGLTFTHSAGKLTQVAHDNGKALALSYAGDLLTRVDSPSTNLYVMLAYNADGLLTNVIRMADGVAKSTRYAYENVCHVMTQRVNAAGQVFAYSIGYVTNSPAWNGNPAVVTARGTGLALEPSGNRWYAHSLNYTNPGGFCTRVTYDRGDTNVVFDYAYDPLKGLITGITGPGTPGAAVWSNTWTRFQYDVAQNLTNESIKDGASGDTLEAVAAYDGRHNVLSNGVKYCGNAATNWTMYSWNADDTLAAATDPVGRKTAFEYTNGLVSVVRECTNGVTGFEARFFYTTNGLLASVTNANGHGVGYENDAAGYVSRVAPALGPDARLVRNSLGQVTAVIVPGDAGYRTNALTVNALGQVTAVAYPGGLAESFAFDTLGNLTNMVDTAGRTNALTWLPTGKQASITRWLDGPNPTNVTISFAYDRQFNTLKIADPMGRPVESYKLDAQDRPVSVTNIQSQVMTVNWGVGDYVRGMTRFDGTTVSNVYNTDGQLLWTRSAEVTNIYLWTPDSALRLAQRNYVDGNIGVVTNGFDVLGRRNSEWSAAWGKTNIVGWQFDSIGNVTNIAVSNTLVRYGWTYDAAERPLSLTAQAATNRVSVFQWNYNTNNGLVASVTNSAITESLGYDILDRATSLVWRTSGGITNRSFAYSFNAAGMITNVSRENGGWTAYTYDSLDRLLSEKQYASTGLTYSASWNYDLAGNRTLTVTNGVTNLYSYASGNVLTNFGSGTLMQYDLARNITNLQYSASRKLGLNWNGRYELTEVRTNGVSVEKYDYDALGRRARIIAGTTTNTFVYSGPHIVAEWSNNVLARSYSHGPGVDNILSMTTYGAATNTYFYIKDAIGSVQAMVTTNGTVVEQYRYTAWGETTVMSSNGTVLVASAYGNRYCWQGREYSWKAGLYYFRARWYDPITGRWLSNDPIGISGGLNLYCFCGNNPVNFLDPFGLCEDSLRELSWWDFNVRTPARNIGRNAWNTVTDPTVAMGLTMVTDGAWAGVRAAFAAEKLGPVVGVLKNRAAGNAFRDEIAEALRKAGRDVAKEVYKRTPFGRRFIDIEVSLEGKVLGGIETKLGASRYTTLQRIKDTWLRLVDDYIVNVVRRP